MKWNKLEYGQWPEGEIVMRLKNLDSKIYYAHGFINKFSHDNEWYFYDYDGPNTKLSIDSIYDLGPHYISLDAIEMPEVENEQP